MDRRTLLAIALLIVVLVVPSLLFPPSRHAPAAAGADSLAAAGSTAVASSPESTAAVAAQAQSAAARPPQAPAPVPQVTKSAVSPARTASLPQTAPDTTAPARTVTVASDLYRYRFSTRGARLIGARLMRYQSFAPGDSGAAEIVPKDADFLTYAAVVGNDTVSFANWTFEPDHDSVSARTGPAELHWVARRGGVEVRLTYRFEPDRYLFHVSGEIHGLGGEQLVLVNFGPRLRSIDADTTADIRAYGVVTKAQKTENLGFHSVSPGERHTLEGPFDWIAIKSKYFLGAILTIDEGEAKLGGAVAVGGERSGKYETRVQVTASLPAPNGKFEHAVYMGPQEYRVLARIGHDFEDVNPYGWIFRPIIRPVAQFIVQILLWMHENLKIAYGWVLILFGLAVRIVLWPLNQKAMRSSMAMQAIQPEVKALQDRHKQDPQKLQQEMVKLYKEHGVNPVGGCLPMLIPMPVLFALFFVFANTIEFRGVSFLWLPDLSRADPYYIVPLVMGISMFAVSKIGQIGIPPNPQAKTMLYVMPPVFTLMFLRFSAGLNLYYAVSNIASIPQQWMIAQERQRRLGKKKPSG